MTFHKCIDQWENVDEKQIIQEVRRSNLKSEENLSEGLHPDQIGGDDHG